MLRANRRPCGRERGFALLVTLLVLVIGAATVFVSARPLAGDADARDPSRSRMLAHARDAVVAYAQFGGANNKPGALPCPDPRNPTDPTEAPDLGQTGNQCQGGPAAVHLGRLPTRTIDLAHETGDRTPGIWYAIDGDFQDDPDDPPALNAETPADLVLLGRDGAGAGVWRAAVLLLPGQPLEDRPARPSDDPAAYLEGENADGDETFQDCAGVDGCNDRVIGIPVDRLFDRIQRRVLAGVERALGNARARIGSMPWASAWSDAAQGCETGRLRGRLPRAIGDCSGTDPYLRDSDFATGDQWIVDNAWDAMVVYEVDIACSPDESNCGAGSLRIDDTTGLDAVVVGAGRAHSGQSRPGATIADYLDSAVNLDSDGNYSDLALSAADNDVVRGIRVGP